MKTSNEILSLEDFINKIPQSEKGRISTIVQRRGVTESDITKVLYKFCYEPWIIKEFEKFEDRVSYAMQATHNEFMSGQQLQNHPLIIPFGYTAVHKTRSDMLRSYLYISDKTNQGFKTRVVVCDRKAS